ncbi:MAG TPA: Asp-tRNA(Asn)/Glu-tRNA(Gln) amidotransferase subunit GatA [Spirochaetota bacterium]
MMFSDKSLLELSALLEKKEASAVDIAKDFINRGKELNPSVNAYITLTGEEALAAARQSDERRAKGSPLSPFDGVPVALKDIICTKDILTTCGSGILRNFVSPYNATSYQKMCDAGMVTLGKTNMDEFGMGSTTENSYYGPTKNPHDLTRVPGGSSGGSAAAVAARMAPAAIGSDTGGSIRQPASFCGVVGIKPTYGRVSRYGLIAYASSLDTVGTFARTVYDAAALLALVSGHDKKDSTSIDKPVDFAPSELTGNVKGVRIGIPEEYYNGASPEVKDAVMAAVKKLEAEGAIVVPITMKMTSYAIPVYYLIATAEASSNLARFDGVRYGYRSPNVTKLADLYRMTRSEGFGSEVKRRIILGTFSLSSGYYDAYYLQALKGRTLIIRDFKNAFEKVDAIVTPVTTSTAFALGEKMSDPLEMYLSDILTISANLAAVPGVSVPVGTDSKLLPIGMQIMGNHFQEKTILNVAKAVEKLCGTIDAKI